MNKKYLLVFIPFFLVGFYLSNNYRDSVYENRSNDSILADVGANIVIVTILCSVLWTFKVKTSKNKVLDIIKVTAFYFVVEIASFYLPFLGIFDFYDLIAYTVGGIIALGILVLFDRREVLQFRDSFSNTNLNL